jgi:hypothetical protein
MLVTAIFCIHVIATTGGGVDAEWRPRSLTPVKQNLEIARNKSAFDNYQF